MKGLIEAIQLKHQESGIDVYSPATVSEIDLFERHIGFQLPKDFKEFYSGCNGFSCNKDLFNILHLSSIVQDHGNYGENWFYFSEYMINSDMWGVRIAGSERYGIFNGNYPERVFTSSLAEFLDRFLRGNVFDPGGLYALHDEMGIKYSDGSKT